MIPTRSGPKRALGARGSKKAQLKRALKRRGPARWQKQAQAKPSLDAERQAEPKLPTDFTGALVGWRAQPFDGRFVLQLQVVTRAPPHNHADITSVNLMLDGNQAVQLGNNLFGVAGATPPQKLRSGWLERMFAP